MAVNGIDIDLQAVANIAERIKVLNKQIAENIEALDKEIKTTKNIWSSQAQRELSEKYSKLNIQRGHFYQDLEQYAQFLKNTVAEYGYVEKNINDNANSFI